MNNLDQRGRWGIDESLFTNRLEIDFFVSDFWVDGKRKDVTAENIIS